jgi:hypothetical protein
MSSAEREALFQVLDVLEALEIPYMVVGSFASTFWGRPRTTHDADLVVLIPPSRIRELARLLATRFYAPEFVIEEAVRKRDQFNAIHLGSAFKVDFWLLKDAPHDQERFRRRLLGLLFEREAWISSPEDVILSKLQWYQMASGSDRQLQDALEVYEVQEPYLEQDYLDRWAHALGLADLLAQIRQQAARPTAGQK